MRPAFCLALLAGAAALALSACSASETQAEAQTSSRSAAQPQQAGDPYYVLAAEAVARRAARVQPGRAKNVILFVGDGMGVSTLTAARIHAGQKQGLDGESYELTMDTLPHLALIKTYAHDAQVSDSAATATAVMTGVKTNVRTLGLRSGVSHGNCASAEGQGTDSLFDLAERAGMATGILSTARITHATPAATFAESPSRGWEDDTAFRGQPVPEACPDIASQLVNWPEGDGLEIAMGGGRRHFLTSETEDPEGGNGRRQDGRDLANAWTRLSNQHRVIYGLPGFRATDFDTDTKVLGLFESSHMQFELDRDSDEMGEPSLAEMTRAAITRLGRDEDGFILLVEGGRIDHAHHGTNAARALEDTIAFDNAIATALAMTDPADTLILVTADHSHTLTISGYPARNNPILGKVVYPTGVPARGADGKPYTTLGYMNGPGAACMGQADPGEPCTRRDLSDIDTADPDFRQPALVPMPSETHSGEDVPLFASGPGAAMVSGVMEQNEIFHVVGRATGLVAGE